MEGPAILVQVLINGVLLAGVYVVAAVGLNLIFGVLRVANIAHGEFIMIGGFIVYSLFSLGISPILGTLVIIAVLFGLGVLVERFMVEKVIYQPMAYSLMLLYAVSIILRNLGLNVWSPNFVSVNVLTGSLQLGAVSVSSIRLLVFLIAVCFTLGLMFFLSRTAAGKAIRAAIQNPELASASGIDVRLIRTLTFGLGSALAGIAGTFFMMMFSINPEVGGMMILKLFAIVIVGGLGNYLGTFVGALVIAFAETLTGFYLTSQFADMAVFAIFLLVIILRPQGLLGGKALQ